MGKYCQQHKVKKAVSSDLVLKNVKKGTPEHFRLSTRKRPEAKKKYWRKENDGEKEDSIKKPDELFIAINISG